ncbi:alpha/beta fold hydrolase [Nocardia sp. NBC_00403]|uniref:alpha/beta fold hydrolase n=1 Tax=Nocardia sp. NBC_00403 TaxID=2975990 RepID=UPI002E1ABA40
MAEGDSTRLARLQARLEAARSRVERAGSLGEQISAEMGELRAKVELRAAERALRRSAVAEGEFAQALARAERLRETGRPEAIAEADARVEAATRAWERAAERAERLADAVAAHVELLAVDIASDVEVRARVLWEGYLSRLGVEHLPGEAPPPTWWQQRPWPPEPDADLPQWDSMSHQDLEVRLKGQFGEDEQIGAFLEVLRREGGQVIRPNQLMMALHMSEGGFVNLRAGGGKTLPFDEASAYMALKHGSVVRVSSHEYLADRDKEGFVKKFGKYGFKAVRLNPDGKYAELDGPTVFFGTDGELVHSDQRGNIVPARALLADEACEVLGLTHSNGKMYAIVDGDDHNLPGPEADMVIWARDFLDGSLAKGVLTEADCRPLNAIPAKADEHGGARLNSVGLAKVHAELGRAPTEEELHRLNNAVTAHFDYPEKDTWFNSGGDDPQVVLISRTTHEPEGNAGSSGREAVHVNQPDPKQAEGQAPESAERGATLSRVENGIHQALEAIAQKSDPNMRIRAEHDKAQQINSKEYFSREYGRFDVVSGASGTLTYVPAERLEQLGWGEVLDAPDYYEDVLVQLDDHEPAETPAANLQQVFDAALADYRAGRPVIVGAVLNSEVEQLVAMAEKAGIPCRYMDAQKQWRLGGARFHAYMTELAGKHGEMVIGNFAVGRGFDRHVSQDTWELGGLALHGTARPDDVAFEQLRRRAARGGVPGSARFGSTTALAPDPHAHVSIHHVPRSGEQNHAAGKKPYGLKRLDTPTQQLPSKVAAGLHQVQRQAGADAPAPKSAALQTIPHSPTDIDVRDSTQPRWTDDQAAAARRDAELATERRQAADQNSAAIGRHLGPAALIPTHIPPTAPQTPTIPTPTSAPAATNAPAANHTATSPQTPDHQALDTPATPRNTAAPQVTPEQAATQAPLTPEVSSGHSAEAYVVSEVYVPEALDPVGAALSRLDHRESDADNHETHGLDGPANPLESRRAQSENQTVPDDFVRPADTPGTLPDQVSPAAEHAGGASGTGRWMPAITDPVRPSGDLTRATLLPVALERALAMVDSDPAIAAGARRFVMQSFAEYQHRSLASAEEVRTRELISQDGMTPVAAALQARHNLQNDKVQESIDNSAAENTRRLVNNILRASKQRRLSLPEALAHLHRVGATTKNWTDALKSQRSGQATSPASDRDVVATPREISTGLVDTPPATNSTPATSYSEAEDRSTSHPDGRYDGYGRGTAARRNYDDDPEPDPTTSRDEASVAAAQPTDDNQVELDTPATGQVDAECAEYALRTAADLRTPDGTPVFDVKVPDAAAIAEAKKAGYYPRAAISWYAGGQHKEYRGGYHGLANALTQFSIASSDGIAGILVNIAPTGEKNGHVFLAYHDGTTMWLRALHKNIPDQPFNPNNPPFDTKTVHGITLTRHGTTQTIESRREAFQDHAVPEGFVRPPDTSGALPRRGMRLLRLSANNDGSGVVPGRRGGNRSDSNTARPNPRWAKLPGGGHLFIPAVGGDWPAAGSPEMGQPTKREVLSHEDVWPTYLGDVLNAFGTNTAQRGMVGATSNPAEAGIALAPIGLAQLAAVRAGIMKRDPREVMRWSTAGGSAASLATAALLAGNGPLSIALPLATGAEALFATYFINAVQRDLGHALRPGEESIVGGLLALPIGALAGGFLGPFLAGQAGYLPQAFDAVMWMAAFGVLRFLPKDHSSHTPEASQGFSRSMRQAVRELARTLGADSLRSIRQAVRELGADTSFRRFIIPVSLSNLALADLMFHFSNVVHDSGKSPAIQGAATAAFAAGGVASMLAPTWMKNWIEELEFRHLASATLVGSAGLTAVASVWDNLGAMAAALAGLGVSSTIITARIFTYLKENFGDSFALATGGKDAAIGFATALGTFVAGFVELSHNHALESLVPIGAAGIGAGLYIGSVLLEKASQRQEEAQRRQDAVLFESRRLDMTGSKGEKTLSFVYDVGNDVAEYLLTEVKEIVDGLASMPQGLTPRVLFVDPGLKHAAAVANPDFIRDHGRAHEIKRNRLRDLIVAAQRANRTGAAARDQLTRVLHKAGLLLADGGVNVLFGIDRDQVEVLCEALSELFPETLWGYASLVTAERGHESQDHAARMAGDVLQTGLGRLAVHRRLQHAALEGTAGRRTAARAAKRWVKLVGSEPTQVEPDLIPARTTQSVEASAVSQQAVAESDPHASAEEPHRQPHPSASTMLADRRLTSDHVRRYIEKWTPTLEQEFANRQFDVENVLARRPRPTLEPDKVKTTADIFTLLRRDGIYEMRRKVGILERFLSGDDLETWTSEESEILDRALGSVAHGTLHVTTWEDYRGNNPDAIASHALEAKASAPWMSTRPGSLRERMETFAAGQLCLVDLSGQLLGILSTNRIDWDGDPRTLGTRREIAGEEGTYRDTYRPTGNTLCILAMNITPNVAPQFAQDPLINSLVEFAGRENIEHIVGSFHPSGYAFSVRMAHHRNEHLPTLAEYVDEPQNDGTLAHLADHFGMQVLEVEHRSVQIPLSAVEFESFRRPNWIRLDTVEGPAWWCGEAGFIYQLPDGNYEYREDNVWGLIPVPGAHTESAQSSPDDDPESDPTTTSRDRVSATGARPTEDNQVERDIPPPSPTDTACLAHALRTADKLRTPDGTPVFDVEIPSEAAITEAAQDGFPRATISWFAGGQHDPYDGYHHLARKLTRLSAASSDGVAGILVNAKPTDAELGHVFLAHHDGTTMWLRAIGENIPDQPLDPDNPPFDTETLHGITLTRHGTKILDSRRDVFQNRKVPKKRFRKIPKNRFIRPPDNSGALPNHETAASFGAGEVPVHGGEDETSPAPDHDVRNRLVELVEANLDLIGAHIEWDHDRKVFWFRNDQDAVVTVELQPHSDPVGPIAGRPDDGKVLAYGLPVATWASDVAAMPKIVRKLEILRALQQHNVELREEKPPFRINGARAAITAEQMGGFAELRALVGMAQRDGAVHGSELRSVLDEVAAELQLRPGDSDVDTRMAQLAQWDRQSRTAERLRELMPEWASGSDARFDQAFLESKAAELEQLIRESREYRPASQLPRRDGWVKARPPRSSLGFQELLRCIETDLALITREHLRWDPGRARFTFVDKQGDRVEVAVWAGTARVGGTADIFYNRHDDRYDIVVDSRVDEAHVAQAVADAVGRILHRADNSIQLDLIGSRAVQMTESLAGLFSQMSVVVGRLERAVAAVQPDLVQVMIEELRKTVAHAEQALSEEGSASWTALLAAREPLLAERATHWVSTLLPEHATDESSVFDEPEIHLQVYNLGEFRADARTDLSNNELFHRIEADLDLIIDQRITWNRGRFTIITASGEHHVIYVKVHPVKSGVVASAHSTGPGTYSLLVSPRTHPDDVSRAVKGVLDEILQQHEPSPRPWWARRFGQLGLVVKTFVDAEARELSDRVSTLGRKLVALAADLSMRPTDPSFPHRLAALAEYDDQLATEFEELISRMPGDRLPVSNRHQARPQSVLSFGASAVRHNSTEVSKATSARVIGEVWEIAPVETARAMEEGGVEALHAPLHIGLQLRAAGVTMPIISPGSAIDAEVAAIAINADITLTVSSIDQLHTVARTARTLGATAKIAVEFDTGKHAGGISPSQRPELIERLNEYSDVIPDVHCFTELAHDDDPWHPMNDRQVHLMHQLAPEYNTYHIAGDALAVRPQLCPSPAVRLGAPLYGYLPGESPNLALQPSITRWARVAFVKTVPADEGHGYLGVPAGRERQIAWVGLGYPDGVPHDLGTWDQGLWVLINGVRCPIAGPVSMDQLPVEVPAGVHISEGDIVVLAGPGIDGEPTAQQWSTALDVPLDQFASAPPGRTRVVVHDGVDLVMDPMYARSKVNPSVASASATVSTDALTNNLTVARRRFNEEIDEYNRIHGTKLAAPRIMLVVKGNAYGFDAEILARAAEAAGVDAIGGAQIDEVVKLRASGIGVPLLAWQTNPRSDFESAIRSNVAVGVSSEAVLRAVAAAAERVGEPATVHLAVNTGLNREGLSANELARLIPILLDEVDSGRIVLEGLMSHADLDETKSDRHYQRFMEAVDTLAEAGLHPSMLHLWASMATDIPPDRRMTLVRLGTLLYGRWWDFGPHPELQDVLEIRTRVADTIHVRAGDGAGLHHRWTAECDTILARIPIGSADLPLPNPNMPFDVAINGRWYPKVGPAERHHILVDLGPDSEIGANTEVVVLGAAERGEPTVADWVEAGFAQGPALGPGVHVEIVSSPPAQASISEPTPGPPPSTPTTDPQAERAFWTIDFDHYGDLVQDPADHDNFDDRPGEAGEEPGDVPEPVDQLLDRSVPRGDTPEWVRPDEWNPGRAADVAGRSPWAAREVGTDFVADSTRRPPHAGPAVPAPPRFPDEHNEEPDRHHREPPGDQRGPKSTAPEPQSNPGPRSRATFDDGAETRAELQLAAPQPNAERGVAQASGTIDLTPERSDSPGTDDVPGTTAQSEQRSGADAQHETSRAAAPRKSAMPTPWTAANSAGRAIAPPGPTAHVMHTPWTERDLMEQGGAAFTPWPTAGRVAPAGPAPEWADVHDQLSRTHVPPGNAAADGRGAELAARSNPDAAPHDRSPTGLPALADHRDSSEVDSAGNASEETHTSTSPAITVDGPTDPDHTGAEWAAVADMLDRWFVSSEEKALPGLVTDVRFLNDQIRRPATIDPLTWVFGLATVVADRLMTLATGIPQRSQTGLPGGVRDEAESILAQPSPEAKERVWVVLERLRQEALFPAPPAAGDDEPEIAATSTPVDYDWDWPFEVDAAFDGLGYKPKKYMELREYAQDLEQRFGTVHVEDVGVTDGDLPISIVTIPGPPGSPTKLVYNLDHVDEYFSSGTAEAAMHLLATNPAARTETVVFYLAVDPDAAVRSENWDTSRWPLRTGGHFQDSSRQIPDEQIEHRFGTGWSAAVMRTFVEVLHRIKPDIIVALHNSFFEPPYVGVTEPVRGLPAIVARASAEAGSPARGPDHEWPNAVRLGPGVVLLPDDSYWAKIADDVYEYTGKRPIVAFAEGQIWHRRFTPRHTVGEARDFAKQQLRGMKKTVTRLAETSPSHLSAAGKNFFDATGKELVKEWRLRAEKNSDEVAADHIWAYLYLLRMLGQLLHHARNLQRNGMNEPWLDKVVAQLRRRFAILDRQLVHTYGIEPAEFQRSVEAQLKITLGVGREIVPMTSTFGGPADVETTTDVDESQTPTDNNADRTVTVATPHDTSNTPAQSRTSQTGDSPEGDSNSGRRRFTADAGNPLAGAVGHAKLGTTRWAIPGQADPAAFRAARSPWTGHSSTDDIEFGGEMRPPHVSPHVPEVNRFPRRRNHAPIESVDTEQDLVQSTDADTGRMTPPPDNNPFEGGSGPKRGAQPKPKAASNDIPDPNPITNVLNNQITVNRLNIGGDLGGQEEHDKQLAAAAHENADGTPPPVSKPEIHSIAGDNDTDPTPGGDRVSQISLDRYVGDFAVFLPNGRKLQCRVEGPEGGQPVIQFHGRPSSRLDTAPPELLDRLNIRLVTFDRPGWGGSDFQEGITIADSAAHVEAIMDHLGYQQFAVVGRSGGTAYAAAAAALLPDRVTKVALLVPVAPPSLMQEGYLENLHPNQRLARTSPDVTAERYARYKETRNPLEIIGTPRDELVSMDREIIDKYWEDLVLSFDEAFTQGPAAWKAEIEQMNGVDTWGFEYSDIKCPVLIWAASRDENTPALYAQRVAEQLSPGQCRQYLAVDERLGHFGAFEIKPGTYAWLTGREDLIRFPTERPAGQAPGTPIRTSLEQWSALAENDDALPRAATDSPQ